MLSISQLLFFPIPAVFLIWILNSLSKTGLSVRGVSWSKDATKDVYWGIKFSPYVFAWPHTLSRLQNHDFDHVVSKASCYKHFNKTLDAILIPRVPGTEGHELVREFIVNEMKELGWTVEEDSFTDRTPHGRKPFSNIIATLNPDACRHLTLACHYDSLYNREYTFLGATDSAVPCAMLIHAAKMLHVPLKEKSEKDYELTLQFIFFDGEEAFKRWSKTDSLYGSRHLAEKWNKMRAFPTGLNSGSHCTKKDYVSYLDRMDVMVLLDLIGTANPRFYSYFPDTYGLYSQLMEIEKRLNSQGLLDAEPPRSETHYFDSRTILAYVEDDHVPFMRLGVPILHLIPNPFPSVWHRESDNRDSLHHSTMDNLNKILRVFIAEYLHLFPTEKKPDIM